MAKRRPFIDQHDAIHERVTRAKTGMKTGAKAAALAAALALIGVGACTAGADPLTGTGQTGGVPGQPDTGGSFSTGGDEGPSGSGGSTGGFAASTGGFAGTKATGGAGGTGGADSAATGGSCGTRAGMRGKTSRTLTVGSLKRTFIAYLPQTLSPSTPVPFVYVFHGANQSGQGLYDMTEYAKLADKEGIAVVFPDGQGTSSATGQGSLTPWNVSDGPASCGLGSLVSNPNAVDFAFVDAMRDDVGKDQCIDGKHIFATGFSMGGYFSHHIACDRPDFRAAAPHSGGTYGDLATCKTTHMPMIIFHGQADILIAPGCDDPTVAAQTGFPASATLWAKKNGCKDSYTTIPETMGQCLLYDGCPADGQVEMCTFPGLGHAWAGATTCANCIGAGTGYQSATQLQWDFFKKYAW